MQSSDSESTTAVPEQLAKDRSSQVKDKYDEIFEIEIECWCYGLIKFPGDLTPPLVHRVIRELEPILRAAIDHSYIFDLHKTTAQIYNSTAHIVSEKEICFSLLSHLPMPYVLTEDGQYVVAQILDQAELRYQGVLERLEKRWKSHRGGHDPAITALAQRVGARHVES
jgi:hypothetical protein